MTSAIAMNSVSRNFGNGGAHEFRRVVADVVFDACRKSLLRIGKKPDHAIRRLDGIGARRQINVINAAGFFPMRLKDL